MSPFLRLIRILYILRCKIIPRSISYKLSVFDFPPFCLLVKDLDILVFLDSTVGWILRIVVIMQGDTVLSYVDLPIILGCNNY